MRVCKCGNRLCIKDLYDKGDEDYDEMHTSEEYK